jgi:hypothetical protein
MQQYNNKYELFLFFIFSESDRTILIPATRDPALRLVAIVERAEIGADTLSVIDPA